MSDQPHANDPELMYEHATAPDTQLYDISQEQPVEHRFGRIVGNQLLCSLHDKCTTIRIKPTEVLEKGEDGQLHLVDKAPR